MSHCPTATTTAPPVMVVCCSTSSLTMTGTMAPTLIGLLVTLGPYDGIQLPLLMPRDSGDVVGLTSVPQ